MSLALWERSRGAIIIMAVTTIGITLGFLNLIVTVIVETAAEARPNDIAEVAREKSASKAAAMQALLELCEKIDKDGDRTVSWDELMKAYTTLPEFRDLMTVMDLTSNELQVLFDLADREEEGKVDIHILCNELYSLKVRDDRMLLTMIKFNCQETHQFVKHIRSKFEELTKQSETFSAQINLLDTKIEHLTDAAKIQHAQVDPPAASLHEADVHPPAQKDLSDTEPHSRMHRSSVNAVASQASTIQEWAYVDQLQQEVQNLLDFCGVLVSKAIKQVDNSSARLIESLNTLMSAEGVTDALDIKTVEVWLAEQKYQHCKSTLQGGRDQFVKQQHKELHSVPVQAEDRWDLVSRQRQGMSQLKNLAAQLLQLDAHHVPKSTIFGL